MKDNELDFETRLRQLQPVRMSAKLRQQLADQLRPNRSPGGLAACLMSLAALLLAAVFLAIPSTRIPRSQLQHFGTVPAPTVPPSLWAYQQAAAESPDSLDSLLDLHARTMPPTGERMESPPWF